MISELTAITRARKFSQDAGINCVPVDIEQYARAAKAELIFDNGMKDLQAGQTIPLEDRYVIRLNARDSNERRRFTALHEIGHIVLELPSGHSSGINERELIQYGSRPEEEILCDVFAAECLLPYSFFCAHVAERDPSMDAVKELAELYRASLMCTASRFATVCREPCTMVLAEEGVVRYVGSSVPMRELGFWVDRGLPVPRNSVTHRCLRNSELEGYDSLDASVWSNSDKVTGIELCEEVVVASRWNQSITLLWIEELPPKDGRLVAISGEDELLSELDGVLPWPSKSRRR